MLDKTFDRGYSSYFFILLIFVLLLFLAGLGSRGLWKPDAPRTAGVSAEMYYSQDYTLPKLNGKPFLEVPPLYYWATSASYAMFGLNEFSARLPSAVAALCGALIIFALVRNMKGAPFTAFLAGIVLSTLGEYWIIGRKCTYDMLLCFFILGGMFCFYNLHKALSDNKKSFCNIIWFIGFALFISGAILSKGILGVGVPGIAIFFWLLYDLIFERKFKLKLWLALIIGSILAFIPVGIWLVMLGEAHGWDMVYIVTIKNNLHRFTGEYAQHSNPFYYYFRVSPPQMLPWLILVPFTAYFYCVKVRKYHMGNDLVFILTWFIIPFIVFCIADGKRPVYILPLFPALALLVAVPTGKFIQEHHRFSQYSWRKIGTYLAIFLLICYMTGEFVRIAIYNKKLSYKPIFTFSKQLESKGINVELYRTGDENLMGAGPFYLGHNLKVIPNEASLQNELNKSNTAVIVSEPDVLKKLKNVDVIGKFKVKRDDFLVLQGKAKLVKR